MRQSRIASVCLSASSQSYIWERASSHFEQLGGNTAWEPAPSSVLAGPMKLAPSDDGSALLLAFPGPKGGAQPRPAQRRFAPVYRRHRRISKAPPF
jgi:hypothetical protein